MIRISVIAALLSFPAWAGDLPDPQLTPGVTNPDVTQATIDKTICVPGWTKTIRPPASYTKGTIYVSDPALNLVRLGL